MRPWQLGQQALWEFINLGGHLHSTLTDESGKKLAYGAKAAQLCITFFTAAEKAAPCMHPKTGKI